MKIQWYPGHMAKAKRLLREQLRLVDIVLEIRDARIPMSSANPELDGLLGNKKRLLILNKKDLADPVSTNMWLDYFKKENIMAIALSARPNEAKKLVPLIEKIVSEDQARRTKKGMRPRAKRAMVVGIPNVGKSSLINSIIGRSSARTGNKPGVTKGNQWVRIKPGLELLDTPGLLWPKFISPETGFFLAATGAIKEEVFDVVNVAERLLEFLEEKHPDILNKSYGDLPENLVAHELLLELGEKWGFLMSGGKVDREKAGVRFLQEFRNGKLGCLSLELPSRESD